MGLQSRKLAIQTVLQKAGLGLAVATIAATTHQAEHGVVAAAKPLASVVGTATATQLQAKRAAGAKKMEEQRLAAIKHHTTAVFVPETPEISAFRPLDKAPMPHAAKAAKPPQPKQQVQARRSGIS